eukprot:TRINITY_DN4701_c0_g1_i2.p1 TRINITY_DN4701_c0_g1~~TRINITY_DN4701_c0_g1_i2.p1  ORF type:complete len:217 (+),score=39.73 TRINITY_DN4701_c0_g1_i2:167-817(+)
MSVCKFFASPAGCMYGSQCRFVHSTVPAVLPGHGSGYHVQQTASTQICKFFASPSGCGFGSRCHFSHSYTPTPYSVHPSQRGPRPAGPSITDRPPEDGRAPFLNLGDKPLHHIISYLASSGDAFSCMVACKKLQAAVCSTPVDLTLWRNIAEKEMPGCTEGGAPDGGWRGFLKDIMAQSDFMNDVYATMGHEGLIDDEYDIEGEEDWQDEDEWRPQ